MATELGDFFFLTLMIRHERAVQRLYQVLADKLPKTSSFWKQIAMEEDRHAERLQNLGEELKIGMSVLSTDRLPAQAIKQSLDFIEPKTRAWANWGVTAERAFDVALYLEGSLIEHQLLLPIAGDSCFTVSVLNTIRRHPEEHILRLQEAAAKYKQGWFRHLFSRH